MMTVMPDKLGPGADAALQRLARQLRLVEPKISIGEGGELHLAGWLLLVTGHTAEVELTVPAVSIRALIEHMQYIDKMTW